MGQPQHATLLTSGYEQPQHRDHKAKKHLTGITLHNVPLNTLVTSMSDARAPS